MKNADNAMMWESAAYACKLNDTEFEIRIA